MPVSFTCSFTKWLKLKFLANYILIDKLCYIIPCNTTVGGDAGWKVRGIDMK